MESKWNQKENIYFLINRCVDITEKKNFTNTKNLKGVSNAKVELSL